MIKNTKQPNPRRQNGLFRGALKKLLVMMVLPAVAGSASAAHTNLVPTTTYTGTGPLIDVVYNNTAGTKGSIDSITTNSWDNGLPSASHPGLFSGGTAETATGWDAWHGVAIRQTGGTLAGTNLSMRGGDEVGSSLHSTLEIDDASNMAFAYKNLDISGKLTMWRQFGGDHSNTLSLLNGYAHVDDMFATGTSVSNVNILNGKLEVGSFSNSKTTVNMLAGGTGQFILADMYGTDPDPNHISKLKHLRLNFETGSEASFTIRSNGGGSAQGYWESAILAVSVTIDGIVASAGEFKITNVGALGTTIMLQEPSKVPGDVPYQRKDQYFKALKAEEALSTFEVPVGYHLEVVASEPMVQEPVTFAFDEDGSMYVCEWLTYMQDEEGSGAKDKISRVVKLVDTNGDGKMDKRTVFIDNILLPRNVLPMGDKVYVILTDSETIWAYHDKDGDGVSDGREMVWDGGPHTGNIEKQSSGLIWNIDNVIYNNYNRFTYHEGKLEPEGYNIGRFSQWGLARDDDGRIYGTEAGAHENANYFQFPGGYLIANTKDIERGPEYDTPHSICRVEDQSGGGYDFKKDRVLTEFSANCGQSVIRSSLMPEFSGSLATCEPVGRLIRLNQLKKEEGIRKVYNYFPGSEFIRSSDPFFRPVWSESGPDGCFYFSDMYRGIIQEKDWFPTKGNNIKVKRYQRVKEWGMLEVFRNGRIYRLVPDGKTPLNVPKLLSKSSKELIPFLEHGSGHVRDNAQKLLVIRGDKSVVPDLNTFVQQTENPVAKMLAMWALRGLDSLSRDTVVAALGDASAQVQVAAIHLSEEFLHGGDQEMAAQVEAMKASDDMDVRMQVYLSFNARPTPSLQSIRSRLDQDLAEMTLVERYKQVQAVEVAKAGFDPVSKAGAKIYNLLCASCHGLDAKGVKSGEGLVAPSLSRNRWFRWWPDVATAIIIKGQTGAELDGKPYSGGMMPPMGDVYNDQQIAEVMTYIGMNFNNWKKPMTKEQVAAVRKKVASQKTMFTPRELNELQMKRGLFAPEKSKQDVLAPKKIGAEPARVLMLGGNKHHNYKLCYGELDRKLLEEDGLATVTYTEDVAEATKALKSTDIFMACGNVPYTAEFKQAFEDFLDGGGRIMLLHAGTWIRHGWPQLNTIAGGVPKGHEKGGVTFDVKVNQADHPLMKGLPASFEIVDELYRMTPNKDAAKWSVLTTSHSRTTGEAYPSIFLAQQKKGVILCCTLGHDQRSRVPGYNTFMRNAVPWLMKATAADVKADDHKTLDRIGK